MNRRNFIEITAAGSLIPTVRFSAALRSDQGQNPKIREIRNRIKPVTDEERLERVENARRLMRDQSIDAVFFEGGASLNYFTGVNWGRSERLFAMILPRNGDPVFIAPKFEEARAREQVVNARLTTWEEHENPYALVGRVLSDVSVTAGTLGMEETTRYFVTENIAKEMGALKIVSGTPVTAGCRSIKSWHELDLMQIADDITSEVFKASLNEIREGMTEKEFTDIISKRFSEFGVSGGALALFGAASAHPHGLVKDLVLREGDIVLVDGGCSVEGYSSDVTRTTVFGKPTEKMRKVWEIVRRAQDTALATAKPGVPAEQIDAAARKIIVEAGYGQDYKYFTHRLGHGIGMEGHEWYYLVRGNERPVQPGNTFSNEPGIYIAGEFGIRLEDEMVITEDGARLLLPQAESLENIFP